MGRGRGIDALNGENGPCLCGACLIILITAAVLLGESFNIIYPLQVGLLYDSLNFQFPVKDGSGAIKVYTAGRRFTGVGFRFVKFPTTWNTVTFAGNKSEGANDRQRLFGRTRDGLRVTIEGSFQYKLHVDEPDAMAMLFTSFGEPFEDGGEEGNEPVRPYEDAFMRFAGDQVRNVASGYDSFDFFSNRTMITNAMEAGIQHRISTELGVDCKAFQLLSVDLPDEFDTALENTEVARQAIVQAGYQRKTASIQAYTAVIEATNDAEVIRLEARAKAKAYVLQVAAELLALDFRVSKEMSAYKYVQDQLGYSSEQLLSYVWLKSVAEQQSMKVIDVQKPSYLKYNSKEEGTPQ